MSKMVTLPVDLGKPLDCGKARYAVGLSGRAGSHKVVTDPVCRANGRSFLTAKGLKQRFQVT